MRVPSQNHQRRRWSGTVALLVAIVVLAEISFLGRLDMGKNAAAVHKWTTSLYFSFDDDAVVNDGADDLTSLPSSLPIPVEVERLSCEEWLEREDNVSYSRDFSKDPVIISGMDQVQFFAKIFGLILWSFSVLSHCFS